MNEQRPIHPTPEMKLAAAHKTAAMLVRDGKIRQDEAEGRAASIARYAGRYMDGYELAKLLDDEAGWSCDLRWAETLDCNSSHLDDEVEAAEKAWGERVNPQPPFPPGHRIAFGRKAGGGRETGVIDTIYDRGPGKYAVVVDGDPKAVTNMSRRIVNFEDATEAPAVAAAMERQ